MKTPIIILVVMLTVVGCAHQRPRQMTVVCPTVGGTALSSNEIETLRSGEVVNKYYVGSYIDPSHPDVRHDPHMIERIEQKSRWNLRPNVPVVASGPTYKAVEDNALQNGMQQQHDCEIKKQRQANEETQNQTFSLKQEINELKAKMLTQSENDAKRLEEKVEILTSKIISMEASMKPTQNSWDNPPSSSSFSKKEKPSQQLQPVSNLNSWEKPVQ
jgi:uncharacterized protein YhaN